MSIAEALEGVPVRLIRRPARGDVHRLPGVLLVEVLHAVGAVHGRLKGRTELTALELPPIDTLKEFMDS